MLQLKNCASKTEILVRYRICQPAKMGAKSLSAGEEVKVYENNETKKEHEKIYVWPSIVVIGFFHCISVYSLWLIFTFQVLWKTILFNWIYIIFTILGTTAGSHRLWAHRSYKAKLPLRMFLALAQTAAFQKTIYEWARDHRVHHKFSDTNADPHNATRGFFFSHMGWLLVRKHPDVIAKGNTIDLSDVTADPVAVYQKKYYLPLILLLCFILPSYVPYHFWKEQFSNAFIVNVMRFIIGINLTGSVNSIAHMWGYRPYDASIQPSESLFCSLITCGEGWHNYHHAFPWDYKTAELGFSPINFTTGFINFMAFIGQAYDLKTASEELIKRKATNRGDGSWKNLKSIDHTRENSIWGWGDKDMDEKDIKITKTEYRKENNICFIK